MCARQPLPTLTCCRHQCGPAGARAGEDLGRLDGAEPGRLQLPVIVQRVVRWGELHRLLLAGLEPWVVNGSEAAAQSIHRCSAACFILPARSTMTSKFNELVYQHMFFTF